MRQQLLIDTLDVWLPASALGLVDFNDGAVGILGFVLLHQILNLEVKLMFYQIYLVCHSTEDPVDSRLVEINIED